MRAGSQDDWLSGPCACECKRCVGIGAHEAGHNDVHVGWDPSLGFGWVHEGCGQTFTTKAEMDAHEAECVG